MQKQKGNIAVGLLIGVVLGWIIGHYVGRGSVNTVSLTGSSTPAVQLTKADELRQNMRKLWTDHIVLTHDYSVAALAGGADKDAIATRLLKNQDDLGAAVATYYGSDAGKQLTTLLKQHITQAVAIVEDVRTNNTTKLKTDQDAWSANGQQIADFLATANPNWSKDDLESMMQKHLDTTSQDVLDRMHKDYAAEVKDYDAAYEHILTMSDTLSNGIIKQFPDKFK